MWRFDFRRREEWRRSNTLSTQEVSRLHFHLRSWRNRVHSSIESSRATQISLKSKGALNFLCRTDFTCDRMVSGARIKCTRWIVLRRVAQNVKMDVKPQLCPHSTALWPAHVLKFKCTKTSQIVHKRKHKSGFCIEYEYMMSNQRRDDNSLNWCCCPINATFSAFLISHNRVEFCEQKMKKIQFSI